MGKHLVPRTGNICQRCGRQLNGHYQLHLGICYTSPLPKDLAAIYLSDPNMSITTLADYYKLKTAFVRDHLIQGGVTAEEMQARRVRLIVAKRAVEGRDGRNRCVDCTMLIYSDLPEQHDQREYDGRCAVCAGVVAKRITGYEIAAVVW